MQWTLTLTILFGFPVGNYVYWTEVLHSGVLPPDGDSIGIPIFGSFILTIVATPFVLSGAWLCLRRYDRKTTLFAWRRDRPWRTASVSMLFGVLALLSAHEFVVGALQSLPWYEHLWTGYFVLVVLWLFGLRAAVVMQLSWSEHLEKRAAAGLL